MGKDTREKIEREIAEGKLGIARDRLHGLVTTYPDDMRLRSRLGDVYDMLGYTVEAGRYWFLDNDLDEKKRSAIDAFVLRCDRDPSTVLRRLRIRCRPEVLSTSSARKRIAELVEDCEKRGQKVPTFQPPRTFVAQRNVRWFNFGCQILVLVFLTLIVVGAYTVIKALFG